MSERMNRLQSPGNALCAIKGGACLKRAGESQRALPLETAQILPECRRPECDKQKHRQRTAYEVKILCHTLLLFGNACFVEAEGKPGSSTKTAS